MCSPRKTGNTSPHRGGWLPGWDGQENGRGRPVGKGQTYAPARASWRSRQIEYEAASARAWKPADERRPAQGSVQRGARNQGQRSNAATTKMRVTTATPEATRERSNERALAEARCPNSVPSGVQQCAPVGHSPAKSRVEQAGCGWQWVERRLWATNSEGPDARPIGWRPTMQASGGTC